MSGQQVRKAYFQKFAKLSKQSDATAYAIVLSYCLQLIAAIVFGFWLSQHSLSLAGAMMMITIMIVIATRLRGFNNIVHECSHNTFAESLDANERCGSICAAIVMGCFKTYRAEHMTHHTHLGDYSKDEDLQGIRFLHLEDPLTFGILLRHVFTPLFGLHLPYYFRVNLSATDGRAYLIFKLGLIACAVVLTIFAPLAGILFVWIPFIWIYSTINYWTDCIDHAGLLQGKDVLETSRTLAAPSMLRLILFPRNDCYHLVHHLFPQIPTQHLPASHKQLLLNEEYRKSFARTRFSAQI